MLDLRVDGVWLACRPTSENQTRIERAALLRAATAVLHQNQCCWLRADVLRRPRALGRGRGAPGDAARPQLRHTPKTPSAGRISGRAARDIAERPRAQPTAHVRAKAESPDAGRGAAVTERGRSDGRFQLLRPTNEARTGKKEEEARAARPLLGHTPTRQLLRGRLRAMSAVDGEDR